MPISHRSLHALAAFCLATSAFAHFPDNFDPALEVIAFGSCNRDERPQPLWPVIAESQPDLWIWGGDNIYADWYVRPDGQKEKFTIDREWLAKRYASQRAQPDYADFREQVPILGTWDDHDYGRNNAGASFQLKEVTRDLALEFMEVPPEDPRWQREGLYGVYDFGPMGKRTKIVLLDNRYFASGKKADNPDLLGDAQRAWLQSTLRTSTADLHILVSGTQILSAEHKWEKWADYPKDRAWLLDLIREDDMPMTILLSGDRHIHEISVLEDNTLGYPLMDITSSGLTHSWEDFPGEPNRLRHGEVFTGLGFGLLRIDWSGEKPLVTAEIRDQYNELRNSYTVSREPGRARPRF